ncbi:hypothetical protein [Polynucleobacter sp. Latsch14-2]|nr:hypothetical protein [Polynucleobacter sp. Latsch14-2]
MFSDYAPAQDNNFYYRYHEQNSNSLPVDDSLQDSNFYCLSL